MVSHPQKPLHSPSRHHRLMLLPTALKRLLPDLSLQAREYLGFPDSACAAIGGNWVIDQVLTDD